MDRIASSEVDLLTENNESVSEERREHAKVSYRYLIDPVETLWECSRLFDHKVLGLDTETFWDSTTKQNQLSLVQIAAPSGVVLVIDALAAGIEGARRLIEDADILMVAHNASFDEGSITSAGFKPAGLVDTLRLAKRTLPLKSLSLASVCAHFWGIAVDKRWQRSSWYQRPLLREQLEYAALDARLALEVYQELENRLSVEGRWEKESERARLDFKQERPRRARKTTIPPARPLTSDEQKRIQEVTSDK